MKIEIMLADGGQRKSVLFLQPKLLKKINYFIKKVELKITHAKVAEGGFEPPVHS